MTYFEHPFVSNSDLSALMQELSGRDAMDYADALRFGTLLHAMILEPEKVDLYRHMVEGVLYTPQEIATARAMRLAFNADAFCRMLLASSQKEVEMYHPETRFEHAGVSFTLDTRRKYDGWCAAANWGWDLKSTTATSQAAFEAAIDRFHYDRARVFYAKGPGAIQDVIIGISKTAPHRIFRVCMKHGDPLWQSGEQKCSELAFKYWALKSEETCKSL